MFLPNSQLKRIDDDWLRGYLWFEKVEAVKRGVFMDQKDDYLAIIH